MCNCNENPTPCTQLPCSPPENCDCPIKDLKSDCIIVTKDLACTNVESGQTLTETLVQLDQGICDKFNQLSQSINLVNTGTGEDIYNGIDGIGRRKIKRIKEGDNLIDIVANTDDISIGVNETNLTTFIQTNQKIYDINNVGTGTKIYQEPDPTPVGNTTTFNIKSLKSNTLNIVSTENEIEINSADFNYIKAFYVNSNYVPTINSPSDGSIIRPYTSYDEAKNAVIGTGTVFNPQFKYATIVLQTSTTTSNNPTVNFTYIKGDNVKLTYTGTDPYMFDTEVLYPLIPKNSPRNDLTIQIFIALIGKLTITRTNGIGLVRGLGSNRNGLGQIQDLPSQVFVGFNSDDEIFLLERLEYPASTWDGDITFSNNTTLESYYGSPHKYSLSLSPTQPLLYSQYETVAPFRWGVEAIGKVTFQTLTNTAVKVVGSSNAPMTFRGNKLNFIVTGNYISTTSATKIVDFPNHYQPQSNRNMIELDGAFIYCTELLVEDGAGYATTGVDNFFKITNNGGFNFGVMNIRSNNYVNKFINISDVSNTVDNFGISNNLDGSKISITAGRYFIDTNKSTFNLNMPNTNINSFLNKSVTPVTIVPNTAGTLSSFFGIPCISGISDFVNDAAAQTAGLVQNSLYFNTTTNALDKV